MIPRPPSFAIMTTPTPLRRSTQRLPEPVWPAWLTILAAVVLHFALPPRLRFGPPWIGAAIVLVLVVVGYRAALAGRRTLNQRLGYLLAASLTLAVINGVTRLILGVVAKSETPVTILRSAAILWAANVITFAVWYWRLDAGGPLARAGREGPHAGAFLFPQMTMHTTVYDERWFPHFIDYLFLSFNTSTAFSPTDVPILSRWAKLLTMTESIISLTTVIILVARSINTL